MICADWDSYTVVIVTGNPVLGLMAAELKAGSAIALERRIWEDVVSAASGWEAMSLMVEWYEMIVIRVVNLCREEYEVLYIFFGVSYRCVKIC